MSETLDCSRLPDGDGACFSIPSGRRTHLRASGRRHGSIISESARSSSTRNLRDLNFEYRAGKYPEEDFLAQRAQLENETAQLLAEMEHLQQHT